MQEHDNADPHSAPVQSQIQGLEARIEALGSELDSVRAVLRSLRPSETAPAEVEMPPPRDSANADAWEYGPLTPSQTAPEIEKAAEPDNDAVRMDVRRAVEQARADLEAGIMQADAYVPPRKPMTFNREAASEAEEKPSPLASMPEGWTPPSRQDALQPALIIADLEGRIELSRIYDMLARLGRAEQAVLLNYTPHSVTVGLDSITGLPPMDQITGAIEGAFQRKATMSVDGVRISVNIGEGADRSVA